jgi:O-antigen/teichoic acid export membrane protein
MEMSVQIVRNILSNWGSFAIGAVIQFLMMPFLVHRLGDTQYGIWVLVISFTGFLGLFDFGVSGSVVKYVAEFRAKGDNDGLNRVCSSAYYVFVVAGVLAFAVSIVMAFGFLHHFSIPREEISDARWVTLIIGLQIGLTLPLGFFTGYMRGIQRYDHVAGISLAILFIRSLFIVVLVLTGYRLVAIALVHLVSTMAAGAIRAVYVFRADPGLRLRPDLITRDALITVSRYSLLIFLYFIATRFIFSAGNLVIGYYLTAAAITLYSIPQRLVDELHVIVMSTGVLQPAVSHLDARGRSDSVQHVLVSGTKYSMMVVLPVVVTYLVVGDAFISLWMGARYGAACYGVLVVLTCAAAANISQYTSTQILQGIARHGSTAYVGILEAAANLALSVVLVKRYGIIGVAVGTLVPMLCSNLIVIPRFACRAVGLSLGRFYREGLLMPCVPACIFGVLLYAASRMIRMDGWVEFLAVLAVCLAGYAFAAWHLCMSRHERSRRLKEVSAALRSGSTVIRSLALSMRSRP